MTETRQYGLWTSELTAKGLAGSKRLGKERRLQRRLHSRQRRISHST